MCSEAVNPQPNAVQRKQTIKFNTLEFRWCDVFTISAGQIKGVMNNFNPNQADYSQGDQHSFSS